MVCWNLPDMISNVTIQLFFAPVCWEAVTACILLMSGQVRTRIRTQKKATVPQAPPPPIIPPTPRRSQRILSRQQVGTPAPAPAPPPPPPPPTVPTFDCQICGFEYSNTLFPRMIKECGHTICERCADHFLTATRWTHLFCPFCKKATLVNGRAASLPKNRTIIELMNI